MLYKNMEDGIWTHFTKLRFLFHPNPGKKAKEIECSKCKKGSASFRSCLHRLATFCGERYLLFNTKLCGIFIICIGSTCSCFVVYTHKAFVLWKLILRFDLNDDCFDFFFTTFEFWVSPRNSSRITIIVTRSLYCICPFRENVFDLY